MTEMELLYFLKKSLEEEFFWTAYTATSIPEAEAPRLYRFMLQVRIKGNEAVKEQLANFADRLNASDAMKFYVCVFHPTQDLFSVTYTTRVLPSDSAIISPMRLAQTIKEVLTPPPASALKMLSQSFSALFSDKNINTPNSPPLNKHRRKTT